MSSDKINLINGALFIVCLICGIISYYISPSEWSWQNLLLNISVSLSQLCLCILIVNIYLSGKDEEGNLEDYHSDCRIDSDGSSDGTRHHLMHDV